MFFGLKSNADETFLLSSKLLLPQIHKLFSSFDELKFRNLWKYLKVKIVFTANSQIIFFT
jgi:hypothetical protein